MYEYCLNNPLRYTDPTGCDTVPASEIWEYNLINYRTDGTGIYDTENYTIVQNNAKETFNLYPITSGENEGNYIAVQQYGKNADGYDIYEYKYVVGKDKIEDFKQGETKGSGYLRGMVKLAIDGGMNGRASFFENAKTFLKDQYKPLNLLFSVFTPNPMNPKDWISIIKSESRNVVSGMEQGMKSAGSSTYRGTNSMPKGTRSNPLKGNEIKQRLKN